MNTRIQTVNISTHIHDEYVCIVQATKLNVLEKNVAFRTTQNSYEHKHSKTFQPIDTSPPGQSHFHYFQPRNSLRYFNPC